MDRKSSPSSSESSLALVAPPPSPIPFIYKPIAATQWSGIYPPILPAPDFFDLEEEEESLKKLFKKDNWDDNPLFDETGKVDLPVNEKGILILDPVSRTRIVDVRSERMALDEYYQWIGEAMEAEEQDSQRWCWLKGLKKATVVDLLELENEWSKVVDEERIKRGLSGWMKFMQWNPDIEAAIRKSDQEVNDEFDGERRLRFGGSEAASSEGSVVGADEQGHQDAPQPAEIPSYISIDLTGQSHSAVTPIDLVTLWW